MYAMLLCMVRKGNGEWEEDIPTQFMVVDAVIDVAEDIEKVRVKVRVVACARRRAGIGGCCSTERAEAGR